MRRRLERDKARGGFHVMMIREELPLHQLHYVQDILSPPFIHICNFCPRVEGSRNSNVM